MKASGLVRKAGRPGGLSEKSGLGSAAGSMVWDWGGGRVFPAWVSSPSLGLGSGRRRVMDRLTRPPLHHSSLGPAVCNCCNLNTPPNLQPLQVDCFTPSAEVVCRTGDKQPRSPTRPPGGGGSTLRPARAERRAAEPTPPSRRRTARGPSNLTRKQGVSRTQDVTRKGNAKRHRREQVERWGQASPRFTGHNWGMR